MKNFGNRYVCVLLGLAFAANLVTAQGRRPLPPQTTERTTGQRLAPPAALKCSRDHLTSFTGRVIAYQRQTGRLTLRVRTDEMTTEQFSLRWGKNEDVSTWLLFRGAQFQEENWTLIERSTGRLRMPMRVTVWVCDDSSQPVIDWQPPQK
ncbi:MAG: hypothetical protein JNJ50_22415 [Acidobacteria bacterium]|nr:hypothetical protein [Acidobacteriota bacterium]